MDDASILAQLDCKALRGALKWSQDQMGEFLGCDQTTVYRLEVGRQAPTGTQRRLFERLRHLIIAEHVLPDMCVADVVSIATTGRLPSAATPSVSRSNPLAIIGQPT